MGDRDCDDDPVFTRQRAALLCVAALLVTGCGVLTLGLRAVPRAELGLVMGAVLYFLAASLLQSAPAPAPSPGHVKPLVSENQLPQWTVNLLIVFSFLLSIAVPWVWIVAFQPSYRQLRLLAPHLFLMMTQVLFEIWSNRASVSIVIRIGIPVAFVSYRMRVLVAWVGEALQGGEGIADRVMLALAGGNLAYWGLVLFYVLLLKVCPPYFLERDQVGRNRVAVAGSIRLRNN